MGVNPNFIHRLEKLVPRFVKLDGSSMTNFVFLTASSANHFEESLDGVKSVLRYFPSHTIIYYDLGLSPNQSRRVGVYM